MIKPVYGLKITVIRSDSEVELEIDMPEVDREQAAAENSALAAVFNTFDNFADKADA